MKLPVVNPRTVSGQRNSTVDLVKLVAAFGVVIIHLAPSTAWAERVSQTFLVFAVPFFLLISLYFFLGKSLRQPTACLTDFGFDRMLVPYGCWTCVYLGLRTIKYAIAGRELEFDFFGAVLFGGSSVHLYFIPLLVLFQVVTLAIVWLIQPPRRVLVASGLAIVAITFGLFGSLRGYMGFSNALLSAGIYISFAWIMINMQSFEIGRAFNRLYGLCTVAVLLAKIFIVLPSLNLPGALVGPLMGYGVCAFALNIPIRIERPVFKRLLSCSFGIYLAHVVVLEAFEFFLPRIGIAHIPYSLVGKIVIGVIISIICVGIIMLLRKNRNSSYLFLGE